MWGVLVLIIIVFIAIGFVKMYNDTSTMKIKIQEAKADLETYLIRRYDVLTESFKAIKNFKEYEASIFSDILKPHSNMSEKEILQVIETQENAIKQIMLLRIPEIQSSELYVKFQEQLSEENNHVSASKRMYNANVSRYNQYIVKFPVNLFYKKYESFLSEDVTEEKKNVDIKW